MVNVNVFRITHYHRIRPDRTMSNDRFAYDVVLCTQADTFRGRHLGHAGTSRCELLIHDYYGERGMRRGLRERDARKGAPRKLPPSAGTKQDVNLAHKTLSLFSSGKVVNGRLGSRPR